MKVLCITAFSDRPETECFIGLKKAGVDVTVMTPPIGPNFQRLADSDVNVIVLELSSRFDKPGIKAIRTVLQDGHFDILHMYNNKAVSNGLIASKGMQIKRIAYRGIVGNVSFFDPASWTTYLNPRLDRVICVANAIRDYFRNMQFLWYKLPASKFTTIYKGHKLSWYKDTPANLSQFGIPEGAFVIGSIANIRPRKGIEYLIDASNYLAKDSNIHILLIGDMNSKKLMKAINNSKFKNNIHLTGFRKDAPAIIAACNTSVLPAIKREGLPKVVIESMSYGVPAIVTNSGGSPELIEHNKSGIIIPPKDSKAIADAVTYLYNNPEKRKKMGIESKNRIHNCFKNSETIKQTLDVYRNLLNQ